MIRTLAAANRLPEAETECRRLLYFYAGHALGRYELGKVHEQMGRNGEAMNDYLGFLAAWAKADADLPELLDARSRLLNLQKRAG